MGEDYMEAVWLSVQYACKSEITLKLKGLFIKIINKHEWSSPGILIKILRPRHVYSDSCHWFWRAKPQDWESSQASISRKSISYCHFFYFLHGIQDCSSLSRDRTCASCTASFTGQTTGPPGKYPAPSSCYKIIPSGKEDTWGTKRAMSAQDPCWAPNLLT